MERDGIREMCPEAKACAIVRLAIPFWFSRYWIQHANGQPVQVAETGADYSILPERAVIVPQNQNMIRAYERQT